MDNVNTFDVIVIGGSYAGLSAAMALGRSLRKVLVIDSGRPCNMQTPHSHNFITQDGVSPAVIRAKAKEEVLKYPSVSFIDDVAVNGTKESGLFSITTASQKMFKARKLIFATGIIDEMPSIKGFADCWGTSVVHCPYCHGYELKGLETGIMANGDRAMHLATLVSNLTRKLSIFTNGMAQFDEAQAARLKQNGIALIETPIKEIEHNKGRMTQLIFADGSTLKLDALYAAVPFKQHSGLPVSLGCSLTDAGHIVIDGMQKTSVEGVFACGDCTNPMRSVASSVAAGNFTGAVVNSMMAGERFNSLV